MRVLQPDAVIPKYANEGDAGCDLFAIESCTLLAGGGRAVVQTGLSIAIPDGYGGLVLPRSGLAAKYGVSCINSPGLIDASYRGEVKIALVNHDPTNDYVVRKGDRIAQLVVVAMPKARFSEVDDLPASARGEGGFGSTGH